eukprot:1193838-Prorocentrum_minimum.AAC.1
MGGASITATETSDFLVRSLSSFSLYRSTTAFTLSLICAPTATSATCGSEDLQLRQTTDVGHRIAVVGCGVPSDPTTGCDVPSDGRSGWEC